VRVASTARGSGAGDPVALGPRPEARHNRSMTDLIHDARDPVSTLAREDALRALAEDLGSGDATAMLLPDSPASATIRCREAATIAGRPWFEACFSALDDRARFDWQVEEGGAAVADTVICVVHARTRALVSAERSALNFLQLLSATATVTARFVDAVRGTGTRILDTRKTIPGLRLAQKYAVRIGGGVNHRLGLYDAVMLKENHILAAGSIAAAVASARARFPTLPLICEVESLQELREALEARVDRVLIDDFSREMMVEGVRIAAGRVPLEVSGGVSLDTVRGYAETGVDFISVGALTKHIRAIDLSMRLQH
jgi:nicotinate-nucleotide pyrophosphorylase (carboxylating)